MQTDTAASKLYLVGYFIIIIVQEIYSGNPEVPSQESEKHWWLQLAVFLREKQLGFEDSFHPDS